MLHHVIIFNNIELDESQMVRKRITDVIGGFIGSIIAVFLMIFIAPALFLESPGPIFFLQVRFEKNGRLFKIYNPIHVY